MEFILENYMLIIIVGLFFVFALIGYLIDMLRNNDKETKQEIPSTIKPVDIAEININNTTQNQELKKQPETVDNGNEKNNTDDLLENYDKELNK